jgi:hypothetical protein
VEVAAMTRCYRAWILTGLIAPLAAGLAAAGGPGSKLCSDPPPETVQWPDDLKLSLPYPHDPEPVFADQGGPFLAMGRNNGRDGVRTFYDLRTGEKVGELRGEWHLSRPMALSRDGKLFATVARGVRGDVLDVLDVAAGKVLQETATQKRPEFLAFAGGERLLSVAGGGDAPLEQFEARTGKSLSTVAIGRIGRRGFPAVSPGGSLIAVATDRALRLFELASGAEVGTLPLPARRQGGSCETEALDFSADGKLLAGLFKDGDEFRITAWGLDDGKEVLERPIARLRAAFYQGRKLEWIPDGSGWLVNGESVVDRDSGQPLWQLPEDVYHGWPRRTVAAGTVVAYDARKRALESVSQPRERLAAVRKAVQSGGSAVDATLPPLKDADLTAAKAVEVPPPGVDWSAPPDPAPEADRAARRPLPLASATRQIQSIRISRGPGPVAVLELAARDRQPEEETPPRRLERIDLVTGKVTGTLELPAGCRLLGISLDGALALSTDIAEGWRLDVWSFDRGGHLAGWRPYRKEAAGGRKIAYAAAPTGDRVLTVSAGGKAAWWSVPDARPLYVADVPGLVNPTLTPGGQYLVGFQKGTLRFFYAATGAAAGDLERRAAPQPAEQSPGPFTLRADGKEAVALVARPGRPLSVVRWDLATGKVLDEFPLRSSPSGRSQLAYAGPDYLLVDDRDLVDLRLRETVWTYQPGAAGETRWAAQRPDDRAWYATAGADRQASLAAAALPEEEVVKAVRAVAESPNTLLKPGASVAVRLQAAEPSAKGAPDKTVEGLRKSLEARGWRVADTAGLTLAVAVKQRDTGDRMQFRDLFPAFGPGFNPFMTASVRVIELECQAALTAGGQTLWESRPEKVRMAPGYVVHVPGDVRDLEDYLHGQVWTQVPGWATRTMPCFLARTDAGVQTLPGTSFLTATGVQTNPPPIQKGD